MIKAPHADQSTAADPGESSQANGQASAVDGIGGRRAPRRRGRCGGCAFEHREQQGHLENHLGDGSDHPRARVHALGGLGLGDRGLRSGCETLVKYDQQGRLVPALATRSRRRTRPRTSTTSARASSSGTARRSRRPTSSTRCKRAASTKAGSQIAAFYTSREVDHGAGQQGHDQAHKPDPYFRYSPAVTYIRREGVLGGALKDIGTPQTLTMCTGPFRFTNSGGR